MHLLRRLSRLPGSRRLRTIGVIALGSVVCVAEGPVSRSNVRVDPEARIVLAGSFRPQLRVAKDIGHMASETRISGASLYFKLSDSQQAALNQFLEEQQNPNSPNYHNWLTPADWATRFGVSDSDLQTVRTWLTDQGLSIDGVSNSHNQIVFSGTIAQIEAAFGIEMHRYSLNGTMHFSPASEISLPATIAGIVGGIRNLDDFRPRSRVKLQTAFTSNTSGNHYLAPDDVSTVYNMKTLYNAGYDGSGQRIAIVGQSAINLSDISKFRAAAQLQPKLPNLVLVPQTGDSTIASGDEIESDLDVEWSGAIAKNADIYFVYAGNNPNTGVFDALQYAIDTNIAPILSISYGTCELNLNASDQSILRSWFQQANAQGQTIVAAAGDNGSADCDYDAKIASQGAAVDVPASYAEVTGIGGTAFNEDSGNYWKSTNNDFYGSAISYIPEKVWNDTSAEGALAAGGGGKSILFSKPSWQVANGVPNDGGRDVPDISLAASAYHDGYLYCSEDEATKVVGSCSSGFRDSSNSILTVGGGTSFGAPIFAGVLAIINEWKWPGGQGNINPTLYTLYRTNSSAFHDVTSGDNKVPCASGSPSCSGGSIGYAATGGYDLASGLGTIDANNLAMAFPSAAGSSLVSTSVAVTASTTNPAPGDAVTFSALVSSSAGLSVPTGTVQWWFDGKTVGSAQTLSNGKTTYSSSFSISGSHVIVATYSGDGNHEFSSGVLVISVGPKNPPGSSDRGRGTSAITVASQNGFADTVSFSLSSSDQRLTAACYSIHDVDVAANGNASTVLTIYTNTSDCSPSSVRHVISVEKSGLAHSRNHEQLPFPIRVPIMEGTVIGFAVIGGSARRRVWPFGTASLLLLLLSFGSITGCSNGGIKNSAPQSFSLSATNMVITQSGSAGLPKGSYNITVKGTATHSNSIAAATNLNLTMK